MCKVISIISCKGGVGKTTTAVNLSASIQNEGRHVCVIDFDHQHNLTMNLGVDQVSLEHHTTIYDLIETAINDPDDEIMSVLVQDSIISTNTVDLIPATGKLAALENIIPMATSREHLLEYIVSFFKNRYDYIFIDCHPGLDNFSQNALTASDSVIIPVEAHIFGAEGLEQTAAMIRMVKRRLNPKLYIEGVLITKYQGQTNYCKSVYQQIEEDFGHDVHIYPHKIKYAIKVAEAPAYGMPLIEYAPNIQPAIAYSKIAREVMQYA